ncbi:tRNA wybutosine-synthesizing protein 5 isoform X1 [Macaca nemestrina]|uniref:tRNA wybutosine-synthesizing protein 5 n=1 Tax=Macaca fascicularis TaxID=9541 RepID=A0A2K5WDI0_MACFA|nr:tRNA wybutosine-synthesizing protein 5 isoform X2 [Macaca fascicularis]XP_011716463.1 tRNA wybutosine-synthesizing protein 5 isoform X1 [Macaca nemestrina]XP_011716464.1 tRNA wybutosine-synthesizing protein 5 isoform X1 [Macaca nemestrina]XP_011716465.1 tRNA wybutosine-synthesizing protein 5 isoform X1 [Macaca nemestrina]
MAGQHFPVTRLEGVSREQFMQHLYPQRKPLVLEGIDLGPCTSKWTVDYLSQVGGKKEVKIHVAAVAQMDFIKLYLLTSWSRGQLKRSIKNSLFQSHYHEQHIKDISSYGHQRALVERDEKYYLRSLGEDPRKDVADIRKQFPLLKEDIKFPEFFKEEQFFSSVFRISSPGLQLWTHYDVMDNLLIQVTGKKRVVLFSPRDAQYLYLKGTKSEVLNIDNPDLAKYPLFSKARRYECSLEAGDVLFIPALWFHNVISEEFGVGVNIFWKHLPSECYDKTDTYGNKDPTAASRAAQILDRALKTLAELPEEYRDFYARRMVLHIQDKAYSKNSE